MAEPSGRTDHAVPDDPGRRRFLTQLSLGLSAAIGAAAGLPVIGFLLGPFVRPENPEWIDLGPIGRYAVGETVLVAFRDLSPLPWAGLTAQTSVYVRRVGLDAFVVFSVNCTHLGCPVNWLASAQIFVCPCHGGVYYRDGAVAAGPPPRPLYDYRTRVAGGHLFVQTQPLPPSAPLFAR